MSSSSLYFIHTIIGGLVQKIPNIGTCGRPASRFKEIGSIYSPEVENSIKMPLVLGGRVTRSSYRKLDFDDAGFTDEVVSGHAENQVDNKSSNDSEQHSNCEITLKEFKDRCKAKKRKASKSIDCTEKDIDFSRKCGPAYVQIKEEDSELEETLSSWKQKLSKKPKIKQKHPGKQSAGLVKDEAKSSSLSDVAQDLILDGSLQTGESCTLNKIKSEVIEMDSYDQHNVVCVDDYSAPACSVKVNPSDNSSTKLLDTVGGGDVLTRNPFSYIKKVDSMDSAAKLSERVGIELDRGESTFFKQKSQDCCISEVSTQYLEPGERINIHGATPKMDSLETTSKGSNSSHTSELKMENALTHLLSSGCAGSLSLPKDLDSEVHGHCQNHSYPKEKHYNTDTEMLDLAIVNLWCTELDNGRHIFDLKSEGLEIVDKVPVEHEKSTESSGEDASDPSTSRVSHSSLQEILCQVGGNSVTQMCDRDTDFGIQSMGLYNESDAWAADLESKGPGVSIEVPIEREMPDKENAVPDVTNEDSVPYHENRTENIDALNTSSKNYDLCFSVANNFHSCNGSLPTSDNAVAQVCDMDTDQSTQSMGLYKESDTCASDLDSKGLGLPFEMSRNREMPDKENTVPDASEEDAVPRHENMPERIDVLYTSSQNSDLCFSVANNSHSCNGSLSKSEKVLSSPTALETEPATIEEAKDSYAKVIVSSPTSELMETDVCSLKPTRPPEKLLSTRKVISPMSQEKLRRAVEDYESRDKIKLSKNGKNLCLEKWTTSKVSPQTYFEEGEFMIKKLKNRNNCSPPSASNSNAKALHGSCLVPCACIRCTCISEHSQKAITFSQRQMHDIESLTTRLVNRLKSMKDIIEDTLLSESLLSMPSKYTLDEINEAMKETTVLEDSARRWLAMMTKDCNRFCKIMNLSTNKVAAKMNSKEQKKVTFADEIGGSLCHVKILERHSTFA